MEAEDFDRAAGLSAQADAAKARLAELQQAVRAADSTCKRLVRLSTCDLFRLDDSCAW